ncbi:hypothetical protein CLOP_g9953, partial [Closterium sp. NIES-67]
KYFFMRMI